MDRWRRYGQDHLYVEQPHGTIDLQSPVSSRVPGPGTRVIDSDNGVRHCRREQRERLVRATVDRLKGSEEGQIVDSCEARHVFRQQSAEGEASDALARG